ncbi:hypothetical protein [Caldiplasma sukawensis]
MKCPVCGSENVEEIKNWGFNSYLVKRMSCNECGARFNHYSGENKEYTIPKPKKF